MTQRWHAVFQWAVPASLRARLLLLVALAALPALASIIASGAHDRSHAVDNAKSEALSHAQRLIEEQSEARTAARQLLGSIATLPAIRSGSAAACSEQLRELLQEGGRFPNLGMLSPTGLNTCSGTPTEGIVVNASDRTYFKRAIKTRGFVAGDYQIGRVTGQGSINYAHPVYSGDGTLHGVLYANFPLSTAFAAHSKKKLPEHSIITLLDPGFTVVARFPSDGRVGKSIIGTEMNKLIVQPGDEGIASIPGLVVEKRTHVHKTARHDSGEVQGHVVISMPDEAILAPVNRVIARDLAFFAFILIAIGIIAVIGSNVLALNRVKTLFTVTRRYAAGDFSARVAATGSGDEISVIENAFNDMAHKNETAFQKISRLNRTYAVLTAINSAIFRIRDRDGLLDETCRIAVEEGGYLCACIYLVGENTSQARLAAYAGSRRAAYELIKVDLDRPLKSRTGPIASSMYTAVHVVAQSIEDGTGVEWKDTVREFGARAEAAFPLVIAGKVHGAFAFFSSEPQAFDDDEVQLLLQLAADTGLGLEHIDQMAALQASEARFHITFEQAAVGMAHVGLDRRWLRVNQKLCDIVGHTREELLQKTLQDITHPDDLDADLENVRKMLAREIDHYSIEKRYLRKNGTMVWINLTVSLLWKSSGEPDYFISVIEDISTRKAADLALRAGEHRYRELFEANPHPMWVYDLETLRFLAVNDAAVSHYGYSRDEFSAMTVKDIRPAEDVSQFLENISQVSSGIDRSGVWRHMKKNGTTIEVEITAHTLDFGGRRARVALANDVTERQWAERKLMEAEQRFRSLTEQSLTGICVIQDERLTYINPRFSELLGYTPEEIIGEKCDRFVVAEDQSILDADMRALAEARQRSVTSSFRVRRKDGTIIELGTHMTRAIFDGKPAVIGTAQDITERKRAEQLLKMSEDRYRDLVEHSQDLICTHDLSGRILSTNLSSEKMLGYKREEMLNMNIQDILASTSARRQFDEYLATIRRDGVASGLMVVRTRTGEKRVWEFSNTLRIEGLPTPIVRGMAHDITERKRAEDKIADQMKQLESAMLGTIMAVSAMVDMRDPYTAGHERRVSTLARAIGAELGLTDDRLQGLEMIGLVHDIGKIAVPAEILSKPAKLTPIEFQLIQAHPQAGYDILKDVVFPWPLAETIRQHHERLDGSGYPRGLKGEEILLEARIMAVADVVEAMSSHRPYRPGRGMDAALTEIANNSGKLYDPQVAEACLRLFREKGYVLPA